MHCFTNRSPGALILIILLFSACSTAQETPTVTKPADTAEVPSEVNEEPDAPRMPTDPDVMLHVFTAETLGAAGDVEGAASEYLKAALISEDPEITLEAFK